MNTIHSETPDNSIFSEIQLTNVYTNSLIDQFFSVLINSIGGKDFLVLVIGEFQSGKTTILSKLIAQIEKNIKPCHIKIRESDDTGSKDNIHPAFLYRTENNQVILLDDAHKLNSKELSIILKQAWDSNKKTSQIILFSEPQINNVLVSLFKKMPKKTSINKLYMPNYNQQQINEYLNHYLKEFNLIEKFTFSKSDIEKIHKKSNGLPGKINIEAGQIYLKNNRSLKSKTSSKSKFLPSFTLTILLIVFLSIAGLTFYKKNYIISFLSPNKKNFEPSHPIVTKKILTPDKNANQPIVEKEPIQQNENIGITVSPTISETDIPTATDNISSAIKSDQPTMAMKPINPEQIKSESQPIKLKVLEETKNDFLIKTTKKPIIFQENWIMTQEPYLYTIQVMAAKEEDSINRFLKLNKNNKNEIAYYKMYSKDGIWFKFISGKYKTFENAKKASLDLPEGLKKLSPWPRLFASIQKDIDNGKLIKNKKNN